MTLLGLLADSKKAAKDHKQNSPHPSKKQNKLYFLKRHHVPFSSTGGHGPQFLPK